MATSRAAKSDEDGNTQKKILPVSEEIPEASSNTKPSIQN